MQITRKEFSNERCFNEVDFNEGIKFTVVTMNLEMIEKAHHYMSKFNITKNKEFLHKSNAIEEVRKSIRDKFQDRMES